MQAFIHRLRVANVAVTSFAAIALLCGAKKFRLSCDKDNEILATENIYFAWTHWGTHTGDKREQERSTIYPTGHMWVSKGAAKVVVAVFEAFGTGP